MNEQVLDKFKGYLNYLNIDASNLEHQPHETRIFLFDDENVNKMWIAFYTAYAFGFRQGKLEEANEQANAIIHRIKDM